MTNPLKQNERLYRRGLGNKWEDVQERIKLLRQGQDLPLHVKVGKAAALIQQVVSEHGADRVYLAFSGGRDSAALAYMIEEIAPEITFVFNDTGVEFPETRKYLQWWEKKYGRKIVRVRPKVKFTWVIENYGYPIFSKRVSELMERVQKGSDRSKMLEKGFLKYLKYADRGIQISGKCCDFLKKDPVTEWSKAHDYTCVILGMMALESRQRRRSWLSYGCYYPHSDGIDRCLPLSYWSTADVIQYHEAHKLPWAELYNKGFTRNGCYSCLFGLHLQNPNKLELLREHHPRIWRWLMDDLGYREICRKMDIQTGEYQQTKLAL